METAGHRKLQCQVRADTNFEVIFGLYHFLPAVTTMKWDVTAEKSDCKKETSVLSYYCETHFNEIARDV